MDNTYQATCTFCKTEQSFEEKDIVIDCQVFLVSDKNIRVYNKYINCVQCKKEILSTTFKFPIKQDS